MMSPILARWKLPDVFVSMVSVIALATFAVPVRAEDGPVLYAQAESVLRQHCVACHNPDTTKGGLMLHRLDAIKKGSTYGPVVETGDPDNSLLYLLAAHEEEPTMPPNQERIPDEDVAIIRAWIADGLLDKAPTKTKPLVVASADPTMVAAADISADRPATPTRSDVSFAASVRRPLTDLALSPDGRTLAAPGNGEILLLDSNTLVTITRMAYPDGEPHAIQFSRDGRFLLAGGGIPAASGRAVLWDLSSSEAEPIQIGDEFDMVWAVDMSPANNLVALGGPSKRIKVFQVVDGEPVYVRDQHTDWVTALAFSPDGLLLASGDRNGGLRIWEAATGTEFDVLDGHDGPIHGLAWDRIGDRLVSIGDDGRLKIWNMHTGELLDHVQAHDGGVLSLEVRGDLVVTGGRDRLVHVRSLDTPSMVQRTLGPLDDQVVGAVMSVDGSRVITASFRGAVQVYGDASAEPTVTLDSPAMPERAALAVAFVPKISREAAATPAPVILTAATTTSSSTGLAAEVAELTTAMTQLQRVAEDAAQTAQRALELAEGRTASPSTLTITTEVIEQADTSGIDPELASMLAESRAIADRLGERARLDSNSPILRRAVQRARRLVEALEIEAEVQRRVRARIGN